MQFPGPLVEGRLIKRYKRFLADVALADGSVVTAHCPNTGSMLGCKEPQSRVWLSESADPKRKLKFTWELVETGPEQLALINTARPNRQVQAAIEAGLVPSLAGYTQVRSEVKYGSEKSRIDLHLSAHPNQPDAWVEVKNVTLCEDGEGFFPDAVTTRGQKHLRELQAQAAMGERAILFFCVNHTGVASVAPADHIDVEYGRLLREAVSSGVEVMAWQADLSPEGLPLVRELPVVIG